MGNTGRLVGKIALITGGASGIGRATALVFAREGVARIYIVDRDQDRMNRVVQELAAIGTNAKAVKVDLTNANACRKVINDIVSDAGHVDIVISNAGVSSQCDFLDITPEMWNSQLSINLSAHFFICQAAAKAMVSQKRPGVILCTVSGAAYGGLPRLAHYGAAKAGLMNLVKTMALELAPYNIRVNSVSPGATDTPLAATQVDEATFDAMRKSFPVPLGRLARPEEIANAFLFLASDDASYVTAIDLPVDSGTTQYAASFGQISK